MKIDVKNAYGFWGMTAIRYQKPDGSWESEKVFGGSTVITESGFINAYTRTSEVEFGYSGTFKVNGDGADVHLDVCTITALEGKVVYRKVLECTPEFLKTEMLDEATGRVYEMDFKLLTRRFSAL